MSEPPLPTLEALSDLRTPWCVHVVATLNIAEHLAAGVEEVDPLAAAARCDPDVLASILAHLARKGLFLQRSPRRFGLTEAGRQLLDPAWRLGLDLEGIGGRMAGAWGTLLALARTGSPAYARVFGRPFWEDLEAHPDVAASFDALMGPSGHGIPGPELPLTGGWESVRTLVDVGGGTGAMLGQILRARPHIHGTLVDLPGTVARARATFDALGVTGRVTSVGQSFFEPLPAGADLYMLRGVLNDWPDREARAILTRCAEAARPSGQVIVVKSIGADDEPPELVIEMVLLGGKHRTVAQFRELAGQSGLEVTAVGRAPSGHSVVECRPTPSE